MSASMDYFQFLNDNYRSEIFRDEYLFFYLDMGMVQTQSICTIYYRLNNFQTKCLFLLVLFFVVLVVIEQLSYQYLCFI